MAKKPKLSTKQNRQVATNRSKRLKQDPDKASSNEHLGDAIAGRVVGRFGKHANIEDLQHNIHPCYIRRTVQSVVVGDRVLFRPAMSTQEGNRGVVEVVEDRISTLTRPDFYDGVKPIAANIDQIIIVSAILPTFSEHIVDRYLVACEDVDIQPIIVINKIELLSAEERKKLQHNVAIYQSLGYTLLLTSCATQEGISDLARLLKDKVSVFVGQSGVGKSSLVNELLPNADETIGDVSQNSGLGTHTTTAAKLLHFQDGGDLIDSPGVREFALWHIPVDKVTTGFIEFRAYLGGCKFRDCKHGNDPGCLIKKAVEKSEISTKRFDSYHKIISSLEENKPAYSKE